MADQQIKRKKKPLSKKLRLLLLLLMAGVFMGALDISIVSPALPTIGKQLHVNPRSLSWIITFYTLLYVISLPLMSALSDRYGRRRIFLINVFLFGAGALLAVLSKDLTLLLAARGVQAMGAGGLFPIAGTVVGEKFPKERHGSALGFIGMMWGVAAILGPLIGGWITQWFDWRAIFYINLILSVLIFVFAWKVFPANESMHKHKFDFIGMGFLTVGLLSLTYALNKIDSNRLIDSFLTANVYVWFIVAVLAIIIFVRLEKNIKAPVIPVSLFKNFRLNIGFLLSFIKGITEAGIAFLPFFAMTALGIENGVAGTLILAVAVPIFLFTEPAGLLTDKFGAKIVLFTGALFTAIGAGLLSTAGSFAAFIGFQVLLGIGLSGLSGAPIRYIMLQETGDKERAAAQSVVSLFSSFGIMVGSALAGSFLAHDSGKQVEISGFHELYMMTAAIAVLGLLFTFGLKSKHK